VHSPKLEGEDGLKKKKKKKGMNYDDILATAEWGRTNELCRLHAMLRAAKANRFGVILLTGSRGSGKNYLVNQVGCCWMLSGCCGVVCVTGRWLRGVGWGAGHVTSHFSINS
jgi:hypothetical protein